MIVREVAYGMPSGTSTAYMDNGQDSSSRGSLFRVYTGPSPLEQHHIYHLPISLLLGLLLFHTLALLLHLDTPSSPPPSPQTVTISSLKSNHRVHHHRYLLILLPSFIVGILPGVLTCETGIVTRPQRSLVPCAHPFSLVSYRGTEKDSDEVVNVC